MINIAPAELNEEVYHVCISYNCIFMGINGLDVVSLGEFVLGEFPLLRASSLAKRSLRSGGVVDPQSFGKDAERFIDDAAALRGSAGSSFLLAIGNAAGE